MTKIPLETDPTLDAVDKAIEAQENALPPRNYLGMSSLGRDCARALWYGFRHAKAPSRKASLICAAQDGYASEEIMASRLRMVDGITLETVDPSTGEQFEFAENPLFRGHSDGRIKGLPSNPDQWHVWENKACNDKKFNDFIKLKDLHGQGKVLEKWDYSYYAQAIMYMHYSGIHQHYLTVCSSGSRATISCITKYDEAVALQLIEKASRIIFSDSAPERINNNPSFYLCKWCDYYSICHEKAKPQLNCRTCLHSTTEREGNWSCAKLGEPIGKEMMCGGEMHLYLPDMLGSKPVEAVEGGVVYADGRVNYEGGLVE